MDIKIHYDNKEQCYDFAPIPCRGNEAIGGGVAIEVTELPEPTKDIVGKVYYNTTDGTYYIGEKHSKYPNGYGFPNSYEIIDTIIDGTSTHIVSNATVMRDRAFEEHASLTSADFSNLITIPYMAFYECTSLTNVNFPNALVIERAAFSKCRALETVSFPKVTEIIGQVFQDCTALKTVTLGSTTPPLLAEENRAEFKNCTALTAIYVPAESVETYKTAYGWSAYADLIQPIPEE